MWKRQGYGRELQSPSHVRLERRTVAVVFGMGSILYRSDLVGVAGARGAEYPAADAGRLARWYVTAGLLVPGPTDKATGIARQPCPIRRRSQQPVPLVHRVTWISTIIDISHLVFICIFSQKSIQANPKRRPTRDLRPLEKKQLASGFHLRNSPDLPNPLQISNQCGIRASAAVSREYYCAPCAPAPPLDPNRIRCRRRNILT